MDIGEDVSLLPIRAEALLRVLDHYRSKPEARVELGTGADAERVRLASWGVAPVAQPGAVPPPTVALGSGRG